MTGDADLETPVRKTLDRFFHLVRARDLLVLEEFGTGEDVVFVGSDNGEVARGRGEIEAFFTRLFARPTTYSWEPRVVDASRSGDIVWFFADGWMTVESGGERGSAPYRISGILERSSDRWLWRQFHGSEPVISE